jgi:hypothetical protein
MPPNDDIDYEIQKLETTLTQLKPQFFIIGSDTNSRSCLWNSPETDLRGHTLNEFIQQYQLFVLNSGNKPTFWRQNGQSFIDVTLCSSSLLKHCEQWTVRNEESLSDHCFITYNLNFLYQTQKTPKSLIRVKPNLEPYSYWRPYRKNQNKHLINSNLIQKSRESSIRHTNYSQDYGFLQCSQTITKSSAVVQKEIISQQSEHQSTRPKNTFETDNKTYQIEKFSEKPIKELELNLFSPKADWEVFDFVLNYNLSYAQDISTVTTRAELEEYVQKLTYAIFFASFASMPQKKT